MCWYFGKNNILKIIFYIYYTRMTYLSFFGILKCNVEKWILSSNIIHNTFLVQIVGIPIHNYKSVLFNGNRNISVSS
jgi:hypothetical protein